MPCDKGEDTGGVLARDDTDIAYISFWLNQQVPKLVPWALLVGGAEWNQSAVITPCSLFEFQKLDPYFQMAYALYSVCSD